MTHSTALDPNLGVNRTGIQMSPQYAKEMEAGSLATVFSGKLGDTSALKELRRSYLSEEANLGSVPFPKTLKGALNTGLGLLEQTSPQLYIDKLSERLAFERGGARLYDALLLKWEAASIHLHASEINPIREKLKKIRLDEVAHFKLLAQALESLGADATSQTPCADVTGMETMGLMQVLTDPRVNFVQSLHAILVAELTDNAGWEILIELAQQHQPKQVEAFKAALEQEQQHLQFIQQLYRQKILDLPADVLSKNDVNFKDKYPKGNPAL